MNKFFRALIAFWGARKLGGGCLSTIVIFIIIYTLLGKCNNNSSRAAAFNNVPKKELRATKKQSALCVVAPETALRK
ncbi:hypothetical protein MUY27_14730 [Mucilaginibacter sp. RS28]|uniref:Uncharacterized protein n=1 Tax=Mucilaginibacter straminoryzae TaxID=2932774 RepID=A0A9X1X4R7_9SPHI|nr:hypothetical protein [Mucilaginibacter straminoryzae]MCJ8210971.1 hypothetical protein [Mucilaginibacter straminoryzae]